jgi:hypothetical protein
MKLLCLVNTPLRNYATDKVTSNIPKDFLNRFEYRRMWFPTIFEPPDEEITRRMSHSFEKASLKSFMVQPFDQRVKRRTIL